MLPQIIKMAALRELKHAKNGGKYDEDDWEQDEQLMDVMKRVREIRARIWRLGDDGMGKELGDVATLLGIDYGFDKHGKPIRVKGDNDVDLFDENWNRINVLGDADVDPGGEKEKKWGGTLADDDLMSDGDAAGVKGGTASKVAGTKAAATKAAATKTAGTKAAATKTAGAKAAGAKTATTKTAGAKKPTGLKTDPKQSPKQNAMKRQPVCSSSPKLKQAKQLFKSAKNASTPRNPVKKPVGFDKTPLPTSKTPKPKASAKTNPPNKSDKDELAAKLAAKARNQIVLARAKGKTTLAQAKNLAKAVENLPKIHKHHPIDPPKFHIHYTKTAKPPRPYWIINREGEPEERLKGPVTKIDFQAIRQELLERWEQLLVQLRATLFERQRLEKLVRDAKQDEETRAAISTMLQPMARPSDDKKKWSDKLGIGEKAAWNVFRRKYATPEQVALLGTRQIAAGWRTA